MDLTSKLRTPVETQTFVRRTTAPAPRSHRFGAWLVWAMGFFLIANFYLTPWSDKSPRVTDIISMLALLWVAFRVVKTGRIHWLLPIMVVASLPFIYWVVHGYLSGEQTTMVFATRGILAIPYAYSVLMLCRRDTAMRCHFLGGLCWGVAVNVLVLGLQYFGQLQFTEDYGLAAVDSTVPHFGTIQRLPWMTGHANAASSAVSLAVPVGLYFTLIKAKKSRLWLPGGIVLLLVSSYFTLNRSAILVSLISSLLVVLFSRYRGTVLVGLVGVLAVAAVPIVIVWGPPGGWERWTGGHFMEANIEVRQRSSQAAFILGVENPMGLGIEEGRYRVFQQSRSVATHNGILQMALVVGVFPALVLVASLLILYWRMVFHRDNEWLFESILAIHMTGLFFFEDSFYNVTFMILAAYLQGAAFLGIVGRRRYPPPVRFT